MEGAVADLKAKEELYKACCESLSSLERVTKDHGRDRESRLTSLEKQIRSVKQQLSTSSKELKGFHGETERLIMEKDATSQEKASLEAQLCSSQAQLMTLDKALEKLALQLDAVKQEHKKAEEHLREGRAKIKECDSQISSLAKAQSKLHQKRADCQVEMRKMENEEKRMESEQFECAKLAEKLRSINGLQLRSHYLRNKEQITTLSSAIQQLQGLSLMPNKLSKASGCCTGS